MPDVKLLRGTQVSQVAPVEQSNQPGILGRLGHAALKGVELPLDTVDALLNMLGQPPLKSGSTSQQFAQYIGAENPSQLEPQSFPEAVAHRFLNLAPSSAAIPALAGGSIPGALARTAAGALPAAVAQRVGFGPLGQDIAQLGTEVALGKLPSSLGEKAPILKPFVGKIPTLKGKIAEAQKGLEAIKTSPTASNIIDKTVKGVQDLLSTETRQPVENLVQHALTKVESNILKGKIEPKDAMKLRQTLYQLGSRLEDADAAKYIQPLTKGINEFFANYAAENPAFFNKLNARDRLIELKNMKTTIDKFAEGLPTLLGPTGKLIKDTLQLTLGKTVGEGERFLRGILKSPEARSHYFDIFKGVVSNNPPLIAKSIADLGARSPELKPSQRREVNIPGIKIIRGSRVA